MEARCPRPLERLRAPELAAGHRPAARRQPGEARPPARRLPQSYDQGRTTKVVQHCFCVSAIITTLTFKIALGKGGQIVGRSSQGRALERFS